MGRRFWGVIWTEEQEFKEQQKGERRVVVRRKEVNSGGDEEEGRRKEEKWGVEDIKDSWIKFKVRIEVKIGVKVMFII